MPGTTRDPLFPPPRRPNTSFFRAQQLALAQQALDSLRPASAQQPPSGTHLKLVVNNVAP